jgi:serine protease Do
MCETHTPTHERYEGRPNMNAPLQRFRIRRLASVFTVLATLSAGILIGSVVAHGVHGQDKTVDSRDATPLTVPSPVDLSTNFTKIAKEVGPAVVNINTEILPKTGRGNGGNAATQPQDGQGGQGGQDGQGAPDGQGGQGDDNGGGDGQQGPDNGMQNFFNHFFGSPQMRQSPQEQEQRALGSGFIVDPRGYIITNDHVVNKADRIYVKLTTDPPNDNGHVAKVVGVDKDTDLAVIKIDVGHPLPTVKLGNSDSSQVGDWVEAIGAPFGLNQTVTAGIVSSKDRNLPDGSQFQHFIQTDAAINPGNSGGPLLNMDSQVIGVNTAIYSEGSMMGGEAGNMGIGFAMPSNTVISVYNQLIGPEHKVVRGSIGIQFQPVITSAVAKMYDATSGVLISSVVPGEPAAKAGLKPYDVIVSIDGKPVKDGDELVNNISPRKPGSTVTIGYLRNGQKMTTTCTIADRDETTGALGAKGPGSATPEAPMANPGKTKLGITVTDLPPNAPAGLHGVLVQSVVPGSFADELQLTIVQGVVIEGINRKPIQNKAAFDAIVSGLKSGDDVVLQVVYPGHGTETTLTGGVLP